MKHRRTAVLTLFSMLIVGIRVFAQTITINEVMADPAGADYYDEFIELYNCGESALALKGYYLEINGYVDTLDFLADYGDSIPACGFALILDRGYLVENKSSTYEDLIPDEALLVTIQDNSLARTGLVNSEANLIYLFNSQADTISAVLTTTKPLSGYSWEKINPESDNSVANWGNSRDLRGTPGFWNSIAPRDQDVAISGLKVVTPGNQIVPNQPIELRFAIKNVGLKIASSVQARCGLDCDADRQIDEIFLDEIITIPAGDSVLKYVTTPGFSPGSQIILAEAIFTADERPENNRDSLVVKIPYTENCLIINEFMYYPATDGGGEWVELFNVSSDTINLKEWTLSDNSSTVQLTGQDFYLPPQNYVVIVNDSTSFISYWGRIQNLLDCPQTMPALNNTRDSILIRGHCGHMIDGLEYSSAWGYHQGTSLERKNPFASGKADNWALSTGEEKATPGRENSIALRDFDLAIDSVKVKVNDLPPPPNSSVAALIYICNNGKQPVTAFELEIIISNPLFGTIADTTLTIISALSTGQTQVVEIVFTNVPGGLHDITVEIFHSADEISNNNLAVCKLPVGYPTGALVINEIMYAPLSGQCEWFEIYNNSIITIDLNNWKFRDALGKKLTLTDSYIGIRSGEYAVVAADSNFALDFPDFDQRLITPVSFPTLNNTTDSLFLYDASGQIVDNVCYRDSWGGGTGISLERLDPAQPALSADNWSGSLNTSTPGQFNSVAKLDDDLAILPASFQFADTLDEVGLKADFSLTIKNVGRNLSGYFIVNIYFDHNRDDSGREDELCWSKTVSESLAPDSTILITDQIRAENAGRNVYLAEIEFRADENPADNHASADLLVAYPAGCLTINEFLAYPVSDQVEFIEFINVTNAPVDLSEWILGNHLSEATTPQVEIAAGDYVVFSGDSACFNFFKPSGAQVIVPRKWPGLNNSSDRIWLKDLTGKTIDSLYYTADWPLKAGYSTEK
ncbi:MAG: lamin tail domain-containing protein, partial [Candidatus Neomarinimicrobiota bacterium]